MDAVKFMKERARLCKAYGYKCAANCPLFTADNAKFDCLGEVEEGIPIVEKWSLEHPQRTRLKDFLVKYPRARMTSEGLPWTCCKSLGYVDADKECGHKCYECWNTAVEE